MIPISHRGHYGRYIHTLLTIVDFMVVNVVFVLLCMLYPEIVESHLRIKWLIVNLAYFPVVFWFSHARDQRTIHMDRVVSCALQTVGIHALFFLSILTFLDINDISIRAIIAFYIALCIVLPLSWVCARVLLRQYRKRGGNFSRVVIVGTNLTAIRLFEAMLSDAGYGYRILGFFGTRTTKPKGFCGKYLGSVDTMEPFIREQAVDMIFYTMPGENDDSLHKVISIADANVVQFYYVPQISNYMGRNFEMSNIGPMPILTALHNPLKGTLNRTLKRTFDIVFSSILLLFSPIVFIPVAIAIKISSPGPIFFRQKRTGYRGHEFWCLKFRTMRVNNDSDSAQASKDDPRKTRVGDFLRRTSIDELPQFINVLRGEMSVVGPRPHMLKHTEDYARLVDKYMIRHMIKPGITGWAQVNGLRGSTDELWKMEKRVEYDVWYMENWTFMLDIKIIARTIFNAIRGEKNAF
jgi:putative colanic acid biosynthesis UDP-glucose lipid carrier transferase